MKKAYISFYVLMMIINLIPFIPLSIKGILGIAFIILSCTQLGLKDGLITATLWIVFGYINFILGVNVDYKHGFLSMVMGSLLYYATALYFGKSTEVLKQKNVELETEISRSKEIEKALKEKITLLESLLDTIPSPIFFKDLECRYIGCNHAFEASIGVNNDEIVGKTPHDISEKELADEYFKKDQELIESLGKQAYETVVKFIDGSLHNIIFNKAIFNDDMNNPIGIVGVLTDVTDKRESEILKEKIVEKKRMIDEILEHDKMKTEFFSNISHELRTPLNVILGSIQLMEMYLKNDEYDQSKTKVVRNTGIMKQNCYRLLRLVNNLIDITKIDSKALEVHLKNQNIVSIVEEITLSVSDYVENKGISLVFDTNTEEKIIACDEDKIERIMLNLLSNAIKVTPMGGRILVDLNDDGDFISIKVQDNGLGIPEDKQGQIFQRFCQVDEMFTRKHEGSGIGLNLVKSLVEMHGGTISFSSMVGEGTCFTIKLPYKEALEAVSCRTPFVVQTHVERINIEFSDIYSVS